MIEIIEKYWKSEGGMIDKILPEKKQQIISEIEEILLMFPNIKEWKTKIMIAIISVAKRKIGGFPEVIINDRIKLAGLYSMVGFCKGSCPCIIGYQVYVYNPVKGEWEIDNNCDIDKILEIIRKEVVVKKNTESFNSPFLLQRR